MAKSKASTTPTISIDLSNFTAPSTPEQAQAIFADVSNHKAVVEERALKSVKNLSNCQDDMHASLMEVAMHFFGFGDCSIFTTIYNAVRESDRNSIKQWIEQYTSAVLRDTKNGKAFRQADEGEFNLDAGNSNPYFSATFEEQVKKAYSDEKLTKAIEGLIKKASKALEDENLEEGTSVELMRLHIAGLQETLTLIPQTKGDTVVELPTENPDAIVDELIANEAETLDEAEDDASNEVTLEGDSEAETECDNDDGSCEHPEHKEKQALAA